MENSDGYPFGSAEEIAPVKGPEPNYHHLRGRASVVDCIVKIPSRRTVREDHSKLPLTTVKKRTFWWPESVTKIRQIAVLRGGQRAENVVEMTGFEPVTPALRTRCSPAELHPQVNKRVSSGQPGVKPRTVNASGRAALSHGARWMEPLLP